MGHIGSFLLPCGHYLGGGKNIKQNWKACAYKAGFSSVTGVYQDRGLAGRREHGIILFNVVRATSRSRTDLCSLRKRLRETSMKTFLCCFLSIAMTALISSVNFAAAQSAGKGMAMPTNTLFVAQLNAQQVVGGSSSRATGTGALLLDPVKHTLAYSLTYEGLQAGGPKSIMLSNFGKSKNGDLVKILCGAGTKPCPYSNSATISGRFERSDGRALDNHLIGEFDSQRIYVEIIGGNGEPEIRGQLAPNGAMVRVASFVAHLEPAAGSDSKGSGTAILSQIYLPGGRVSVFYAATVAGTTGAPTSVGLVANQGPNARSFTPQMALPKLELLSSRDEATGGSLQGLFDVNSAEPDAPFVKRILSAGNGEVGIVITTSRFTDGELYGTLVPVR